MCAVLDQRTGEIRMVELIRGYMTRRLESTGLVESLASISDVDAVASEMEQLCRLNLWIPAWIDALQSLVDRPYARAGCCQRWVE